MSNENESDRELLELAAKAAGYDTSHKLNEHRMLREPPIIGLCIKGVSTCWNPLTYDGDAFRLMVKLKIMVGPAPNYPALIQRWAGLSPDLVCTEEDGNDPEAATRRAIVRVAAEIGRRMSSQ